MSIKKTTTAAGVIALMLALTTACTAGTDEVPSETKAPAAVETTAPAQEPTVDASAGVEQGVSPEWGIDVSTVDLSAVSEAYGTEQTQTLVTDALTALSIATNEAVDLHSARDAEGESLRYEIVRDYVTSNGWDGLMKAAAAPDEDTAALGFMPHAPLSGEYEGVAITSMSAELLGAPTVSLYSGETADAQRAVVTINERLTVALESGDPLTADRTLALYMIPGADGRWLVDTWSWQDAGAEG